MGVLSRIRAGRRRFARNLRGIAATEFASVAPVMLMLYFGVTELYDALIVKSKVTAVASPAADLVAQDKSITDPGMLDIFLALDAIMFPYPAADEQVVISSLVDAGSNKVKVAWSDGHNATARAVNSYVTIPDGLVVSGGGGSVIMAEVTYSYHSPAGELIYGSIPITDKFYLRPRRVLQVARVP